MARLACAIAAIVSLAAGACSSDAGLGSNGADIRSESVVTGQMTSEPARMGEALINQYRAARGLVPVRLDLQIETVAYQQAKAMADRDTMGHTVAGDFASRLRANQVLNVYAGENIGRNFRTVEKMFAYWAASPSHAANLANPHVSRLGFAVVFSAGGRPYWAMAVASHPL